MSSDALTFEVQGTKDGRPGRWRMKAPNVAEAKRRAAANGIAVTDAVFVKPDPVAVGAEPADVAAIAAEAEAFKRAKDQDRPRKSWRKSEPYHPTWVRVKPGEAFLWGFWAGLGAWFAMVVLSFVLFAILMFAGIGAALTHGGVGHGGTGTTTQAEKMGVLRAIQSQRDAEAR